MKIERRKSGETEEEKAADRLASSHVTRAAADQARRARLAAKKIDPAAAEALRRLWAEK